MKNIYKICIALLAIFIFNLTVSATIKENTDTYANDVYVIGSSKFEGNFTITASRAATAGANEAYLQYMIFGNTNFNSNDIKTYYYCALDETWSMVASDGTELVELNKEEKQILENNLDLYYVNNKEKTIEVSFDGVVDDGSITPNAPGARMNFKVEDGKIIVPASWIGGFTFSTNNVIASVDLSKADTEKTEELDNPIIKISPEVSVLSDDEVYVNEELEILFGITSNDYNGVKATVNLIAINGGNSLTANYDKEIVIENISKKATLKFSEVGTYTIKYLISYDNGSVTEVTKIINVLASDTVLKTERGYFSSIQSAIEAGSREITVLKDFNIATQNKIDINNDIIINFNGKTVTANANTGKYAEPAILIASGNGGKIIFKNGSLVRTEDSPYGVIQIGQLAGKGKENTVFDLKGTNIILEKDFTLKVNWYGITVLGSNSTLDVYGTILTDGAYTISGNYSGQYLQNITVNIYDGAKLESTSDSAIYMPSYMNVNIFGGEIIGKTGIGIKLGNLNITGGKITATGDKTPDKNLKPTGNGFNPTGDAIFVEVNDTYYKHYQTNNQIDTQSLNINITGGTITSEKANVIRVYNPTKSTPEFNFDLTKSFGENNTILYNNTKATLIADGVKYANIGNDYNTVVEHFLLKK
jgi:hypothetical protein